MNQGNFYISSVVYDKNRDNDLTLVNIRGKTKEYYFTSVIVPVSKNFIKDRSNEINESSIIVPVCINDNIQYFYINLAFVKKQRKLKDVYSYLNFENLVHKKVKLTDKYFNYSKFNIHTVVWVVLAGMITAYI
jgi:hypothetical protein